MPSKKPSRSAARADVYRKELECVTAVLGKMLTRLESEFNLCDSAPQEEGDASRQFWWGKESVLSAFTKVTQLLLKVIEFRRALEAEQAAAVPPDEMPAPHVSEEDWEIVKRFLSSRETVERIVFDVTEHSD